MNHQKIASFIWQICDLLRGHYERHKYRDVILPMTVLRRLDCVLASTKSAVLEAAKLHSNKSDNVRHRLLEKASGLPFYNTSRLDFQLLLNDPNQLAQNLRAYIRGFSENIQEIIERFEFDDQISKLTEQNSLYEVVKAFAKVDFSPEKVDNMQMGYAFEELIRVGAEQSNAEAGDHFTPREVIKLMVNLLLSSDPDLGKSHVIKTIYDPACGTGGMLSGAEDFLKAHNAEAMPILFGQDINDDSWAVCKSDMLLKGQTAKNIVRGNTLTNDGFKQRGPDEPWAFDYMLANPPFGVSWKNYRKSVEQERDTQGYRGRFGAGTPRISDGSLLFLQHMLSKMQPVDDVYGSGRDGGSGGGRESGGSSKGDRGDGGSQDGGGSGSGGSRIAIVFNGSPLFSGDAGSGESEIRRWIIENDWLEAIVALPDQMFYNTGISTYVWILTNRKEPNRVGKIQLIDGREFYQKMRKSLGNKRNELSDAHIDELTEIHGNFRDGETRDLTDEDPITHLPRTRSRVVSKVFANSDFGFRKITVERPLRLNFAAVPEKIARIEDDAAFRRLAVSRKKDWRARDAAVAEGEARQKELRQFLEVLSDQTGGRTIHDREAFIAELSAAVARTGVKLKKAERDMILEALGERDPEAAICRNRSGKVEADPELRDTETVPLSERIDDFMAREVHPHHPDAWVDIAKTKIGYEIPLNRHFFEYEPPRPLEEIRANMQELEREFVKLLAEVAG